MTPIRGFATTGFGTTRLQQPSLARPVALPSPGAFQADSFSLSPRGAAQQARNTLGLTVGNGTGFSRTLGFIDGELPVTFAASAHEAAGARDHLQANYTFRNGVFSGQVEGAALGLEGRASVDFDLKTIGASFVSWVKGLPNWFASSIANPFVQAGNWVAKQASAVGNAMGDAAKAVGNAVGDAAKTVGNAISGAAKAIGNFFKF